MSIWSVLVGACHSLPAALEAGSVAVARSGATVAGDLGVLSRSGGVPAGTLHARLLRLLEEARRGNAKRVGHRIEIAG